MSTAIRLDQVVESPTNPRRTFNPIKLAELSDSIKRNGLVQAIVVREEPRHPGMFEIVCGARRFRASQLAGLDTINAECRFLSDDQVIEIQLVENCQREDVHPMEEAEGFERLLSLKGPIHYTPEILAERIGVDVGYVYRRLALNKLIEPLQGKFLNDEITVSHALKLARIPEADQIRAAKEVLFQQRQQWMGDRDIPKERVACSVTELDNWIRREVYMNLNEAPWDKELMTIETAGSCICCAKRSGANLHLFDDLKKGEDRCLDSICYGRKEKKFIEIELSRDLPPQPVSAADGYSRNEEKKLPKGTLMKHQWRAAKALSCSSARPALVVMAGGYGKEYRPIGQRLDICADDRCQVHFPKVVGSSHRPSLKDQWQGKERNLPGIARELSRKRLVQAIVGKAPASFTRRELALVGVVLAETCLTLGEEHREFFPDIPGDKLSYQEFTAAVIQRLREQDDCFREVFTLAMLAAGSRWGFGSGESDPLTLAASYYNVDIAKVVKAATSEARTSFEREKALAFARDKKSKARAKKKAKAAPKKKAKA